jgi:hypothetical protein
MKAFFGTPVNGDEPFMLPSHGRGHEFESRRSTPEILILQEKCGT